MAMMSSKKKVQNFCRDTNADAIAKYMMQKQREYLEPRLSEIQQMGKDNNVKLSAIQTELTTLTTALNAIKSDVDSLKTAVGSNSSTLNKHDQALQAMELKLEYRNRRCNIRVIGLDEGLEVSNATQVISRSLPKWFPTLDGTQTEIMSARRIYNDNARNRGANRTLIFNVLRYSVLPGRILSPSTGGRFVSLRITATSPSGVAKAFIKLWIHLELKVWTFFSALPGHTKN